jgi:Ca2+/Na+ antiporter
VIIGAAILATPPEFLPLEIGLFSFSRDALFYVGSVVLLYWVLSDGLVSRTDSLILLAGALLYSATVMTSDKLRMWLKETFAKRSFSRRDIEGLAESLLAESLIAQSPKSVEPHPAIWAKARGSTNTAAGSVLGVRVDLRNRMMDRNAHFEERFMRLTQDHLMVSTVVGPNKHSTGHAASGIMFDHCANTQHHHQHHGGLVNLPVYLDAIDEENSSPPAAAGRETRQMLDLDDAPWEKIPLQDILYCEEAPTTISGEHQSRRSIPAGSPHVQHEFTAFTLHVHQHNDQHGNLITLEFTCHEEPVVISWVAKLKQRLEDQKRASAMAPPEETWRDVLSEIIDWFQRPVKLALRLTIPDMDKTEKQWLYPVSFIMSMAWLSIFAFSVVFACDGIHADFGISTQVLGFTVAAAGTSFPNVFSGMVVARQGKTTMAIANALGANVQNVFLALAVPWAVQAWFIERGSFALPVSDLTPAVLECGITLLPVVIVFVCYSCSMPRWSGVLYLLTYLVYLVCAVKQAESNCPSWPIGCSR